MPDDLTPLATRIAGESLIDEGAVLARLIAEADLDAATRARIVAAGADLVARIRASVKPGLMEVFLAEYGLSTEEGIALMCLAEALLRVPDAETMDALIEDKIAPSDWGRIWALGLIAGQCLDLGADADRQGAGRPGAGDRAGICAAWCSGWASR